MLQLTLTQHCRWGAGWIFNSSVNAAGAKFQKLKHGAGAVFQKQIWHVDPWEGRNISEANMATSQLKRWQAQYYSEASVATSQLKPWQAQYLTSKPGHLTA